MEDKYKELFDFIIIGGGPAGSTMATLLGRKGYKVLLLEKEKFPRPHVGESMLSQSYFLFKELGVLDEMKKRFMRKPGAQFSNDSGEMTTEWYFTDIVKDESALSFHVRRDEFDHLLLENSRKNGALVLEETRVVAVDLEENSEVNITAESKTNGTIRLNSKYLVDASGQGTFLANKFKSKKPFDNMSSKIAIGRNWKGAQLDKYLGEGDIKIIRHEIEGGGWMWMIPVDEHYISVGVVVPTTYYKSIRQKLQKNGESEWLDIFYKEVIFKSADASTILKEAEMIGDYSINSDYSYRNVLKYGDNFACVGDASSFVDPVFSSGVYIALNSSFIISDALDELIKEGNQDALPKAYEKIEGAYKIVEALVANFYDPNALNIDGLRTYQSSNFEHQRKAMQTFRLLVSGKFFDVPDKYLQTIAMLKDERKLKQLEHYVYNKV